MSRIAYIAPSGQIATVSPEGGSPRVLTEIGTAFQFPAWSPDGASVAAVGASPGGVGVYIVADELGAPAVQTCYQSREAPPVYLSWSPRGDRLGFIAFYPDGLRLMLAKPGGDDLLALTQGQPCFWDWAPDGASLLVHTGARVGEPDLAFYAADGSGRGPRLAEPGLFQAPAIARSGRCWAFAEVGEGGETWLVIDRADGQPRVSLPHEGALALAWCPTREQLAFICPPAPAQQFYGPIQVINLGTEFVRTLVAATALAFFWSPDGRRIAYLTLPGDADRRPPPALSRSNGVYTNGRTPPQRAQRRPSSRQGLDLWVVDVFSGEQRHLTSFAPTPPFAGQMLPFFDQYARSHSFWAPDSSALVVPSLADGQPQILVVPADGAAPFAVAEGVMAAWSHR